MSVCANAQDKVGVVKEREKETERYSRACAYEKNTIIVVIVCFCLSLDGKAS